MSLFETINSFVTAFFVESGASKKVIENWQEKEDEFKIFINSITPKKVKNKKVKKSKDAPKNARNAYIFFCGEKRPEVKEKNPDMVPKDILKELGGLWQITDDKMRAKYQNMADEDKKRYGVEMKNYIPSDDEKEVKDGKKKRVKKSKDAPKGAKSAYMFLCIEKRSEVKEANKELGPKEILKELGKLWQNTQDRKQYEDMAQKDKERYNEEMENYVPIDDKDVCKKARKPRSKKVKGSPKNAKSAYMFFCADKREVVKKENPDMKSREILGELGKMWKEIKDTSAAKKYEKMVLSDKDRYNEEMEKFKNEDSEDRDEDDEDDERVKHRKAL